MATKFYSFYDAHEFRDSLLDNYFITDYIFTKRKQ
jgi:hypothetical protein